MNKHFTRLFMSFFIALITTWGLSAQNGIISGKVTDGTEGLIGASVQVVGTSTGTVTDINGNYSISIAPGSYSIEVTYVGYATQRKDVTVSSGSDTKMDFLLTEGLGLDEIVVVGSRNPNRTATETAVPVDVIDISELTNIGPQTDVNQLLNFVAPSFTSNTQTVADGTDHIDPASLRGLGPDQVLVLINGKRRHTSSLVNVNGTFGAGSVGTDMNAIPTASIERIEVLRDGAAAQYGSDAIAGVINIVLKKQVNKLAATLTTGGQMSKNSNNFDGGMDGEKVQLDLNYGLPIGDKGGVINLTGSFSTRGAATRNRPMGKPIYLAYHGIENVARNDGYDVSQLQYNMADIKNYGQQVSYFSSTMKDDINNAATMGDLMDILKADVSDSELAVRGLSRSDFSMKSGQAALRGGKFFANMSLPTGDSGEFYAFGGLGYRNGKGAGFYRRPAYTDGRGNTPAFPNGFLPHITSNILDKSLALGIKGKLGEWNSDLSNTYGQNSFDFFIVNTSNSTLGTSTPREFNAGGFTFGQNTSNWDLSRFYDNILSGMNVALGSEFRVERYALHAGEEASWASYDKNGQVVTSTTPDSLKVKSPFGKVIPGGSQVFPGYRPSNEVDAFRTSYAGYVDLEFDMSKAWMVDVAGRYENYSDFGSTFTYKIATRVDVNKQFAIRGAYSTGFRAPSLHQINFNATGTQFVNGIPYEVGTFANNSRAAELFGIPKLKEETSQNYSIGFTSSLKDMGLTFTLDGYMINVNDRVVLTGNFSKPDKTDNPELWQIFENSAANRAKFFTNAVNTSSKGIDAVLSHDTKLGGGRLNTSLALTLSKTEVEKDANGNPKINQISDKLRGLESTYFGESNRINMENAVPTTKANLTFNYSSGKFGAMLRNVYFGAVTDPDLHKDKDGNKYHAEYGAKIITDLSLSYDFSKSMTITVGANNLLDIYPDEIAGDHQDGRVSGFDNTYGGQFNYSRRVSQFGYMGRFIFGRVALKF
ncbi:MAG TPA: TonB-dependent receptor [Saprospiraceae bacterium]|nr:TonB-dependent receptor [Saprospiraceae bacterium]